MSYQIANSLLHFLGGFIGKGQCKDIPWLHSHLQQIGYLVSQHARLSRPRTGNHQLGTVYVFNGNALAVIQLFK